MNDTVKWMGVLIVFDEPATREGRGTYGNRLQITQTAAEDIVRQVKGTYLSDGHISFMPHFYKESVVGQIEEAIIVDNKVIASGYVKKSFVETKVKGQYIGLSIEAHVTRDGATFDHEKGLMLASHLEFAGAAITEEPAYEQTSFEILS